MSISTRRIIGVNQQGHTSTSSHEVYFHAKYYDHEDKGRHGIYKKNKFQGVRGERSSILETGFTAIANLFAAPHRALRQDVVRDENNLVKGVFAEHAAYVLLRHENNSKLLPPLSFPTGREITAAEFNDWLGKLQRVAMGNMVDMLRFVHPTPIDTQEEIKRLSAGSGFNFMDKMPQNFFSLLMQKHQAGQLIIDMDSIADVLTTAYGLEEDDLHRGNIGFYITQEPGSVPHFHFFKIDHDLMFSDKIMASTDQRIANITYTEHEFRVTQKSLSDFPDIDTGNHYWPTHEVIFAKGNKAYHSNEDRMAFAALKHNTVFQQAKWTRFLKQTVIPVDMFRSALTAVLDEQNPEELSAIRRIHTATVSRISELQVRLIESPEFRSYFLNHFDDCTLLITRELSGHAQQLNLSSEKTLDYIRVATNKLEGLRQVCEFYQHNSSISSLHIAVLSKNYRCFETARYFKHDLHKTDQDGKTALDHALDQFKNTKERYYADVIQDLVQHGAKHHHPEGSDLMKQAKETCSLHAAAETNSLTEFKEQLNAIQNNPLFSLKQKKVMAVHLLAKATLSMEELVEIKEKLSHKEPEIPYQFINELRSTLWFIRRIRGAYGFCTTTRDMKDVIASKMAEIKRYEPANQPPLEQIKSAFIELKNRFRAPQGLSDGNESSATQEGGGKKTTDSSRP